MPDLSCCLLGLAAVLIGFLSAVASAAGAGPSPIGEVIARTQPKIVKVYGAGGFRGMEAYQSGMLISPEGHILTIYSYVLDGDRTTVTLDDGRRFDAKLLGADPHLEVALLKIEAEDLPCFDLAESEPAESGQRVLAFSNLFGVAVGNEPASVQHGVVSVKTTLSGRRGVFETPYRGPVYVLDAMTNNPGAAGGALVSRDGELIGMLGKELRNAANNTWLNYAVPIEELRPSVDLIAAGKFAPESVDETDRPERALTLAMLGIVLVPDVLERTPPYVDDVRRGSAAAAAQLAPDDLILLMDDRLIQSCKSLREELEFVDFEDPVTLTVLRGTELLRLPMQVETRDGEESP